MLSRFGAIWLLAALLLLQGCASGAPAASDPTVMAQRPADPAVLTSGRFSTRHGTLHFGRELVLHADGHVTEKLLIAATDEFAAPYRQPAADGDGWQVTKVEDPGRVNITLVKEYASVAEFNAIQGAEQEGVFTKINGPFFRKQSFRITVGGVNEDAILSAYGGHPQATAEDWADYLGHAITYSYRITLPSEVTKSASGTVLPPGTTLHWERPVAEMGGVEVILVESKRWHWTAWVMGALLALVVGGAAMVRLTRRLWDPDESMQ